MEADTEKEKERARARSVRDQDAREFDQTTDMLCRLQTLFCFMQVCVWCVCASVCVWCDMCVHVCSRQLQLAEGLRARGCSLAVAVQTPLFI
jgi:hypothetical protein